MTTIPQVSVDAQVLARRLAEIPVGAFVPYGELNQSVPGRTLNGKDRFILETARKIVQREHRMVFAAVLGKGIRRMNDAEISEIHLSTARKVRGLVRRDSRKMLCADPAKLTNSQRVALNTGLAFCGAVAQFAKADSVKRIAFETAVVQRRLSFDDTLKQFQK